MSLAAIRAGVATALAGADGAVYPKPPGARNENPSVVVLFDNFTPLTIGGATFQGRLRLHVAFACADQEEGWAMLDTFLDQSGSNSIHALINADTTLDGSVDSAAWAGSESIRAEEENEAIIARCEVLVDFLKG